MMSFSLLKRDMHAGSFSISVFTSFPMETIIIREKSQDVGRNA